MPLDLEGLVDPQHTTLVTQESQLVKLVRVVSTVEYELR